MVLHTAAACMLPPVWSVFNGVCEQFEQGVVSLRCNLCLAAASCTLGTYMGKGYVRTKRVFPQGVFALTSLLLSGGYIISIT